MRLPKINIFHFTHAKETAGLPPGQLIHIGEKLTDKTEIDHIYYNDRDFHEKTSENTDEILADLDQSRVHWINVDGLHNVESIRKLGEHFELDPLLLEDILNTHQRPKSEEYENSVFFTLKTLNAFNENDIIYEQISFVLGKNVVLSFQEKEGDLFGGLRTRLRNPQYSKARKKGADYLFYRLIDITVDSYYVILENIAERIESLEEELWDAPQKSTLQKIQQLKKELIILRKSIYPVRESLSGIAKGEYPLIKKDTIKYFTDVYDHILHIIESFETYRDLAGSLMDMYMTNISNRMNEVMKVLTIIATIFIPLTFIAGIYGMNFQHMPELSWRYGYVSALSIMAFIFITLILYFKRKKWI